MSYFGNKTGTVDSLPDHILVRFLRALCSTRSWPWPHKPAQLRFRKNPAKLNSPWPLISDQVPSLPHLGYLSPCSIFSKNPPTLDASLQNFPPLTSTLLVAINLHLCLLYLEGSPISPLLQYPIVRVLDKTSFSESVELFFLTHTFSFLKEKSGLFRREMGFQLWDSWESEKKGFKEHLFLSLLKSLLWSLILQPLGSEHQLHPFLLKGALKSQRPWTNLL